MAVAWLRGAHNTSAAGRARRCKPVSANRLTAHAEPGRRRTASSNVLLPRCQSAGSFASISVNQKKEAGAAGPAGAALACMEGVPHSTVRERSGRMYRRKAASINMSVHSA